MKKNGSVNSDEGVYIKENRSLIFILFKNLMWIEAEGNYVSLHIRHQKKRIVRSTLLELQKQLPVKHFVRIHKTFIINLDCITEAHSNNVFIGHAQIPIGRKYKKEFLFSFSEFIKKKNSALV